MLFGLSSYVTFTTVLDFSFSSYVIKNKSTDLSLKSSVSRDHLDFGIVSGVGGFDFNVFSLRSGYSSNTNVVDIGILSSTTKSSFIDMCLIEKRRESIFRQMWISSSISKNNYIDYKITTSIEIKSHSDMLLKSSYLMKDSGSISFGFMSSVFKRDIKEFSDFVGISEYSVKMNGIFDSNDSLSVESLILDMQTIKISPLVSDIHENMITYRIKTTNNVSGSILYMMTITPELIKEVYPVYSGLGNGIKIFDYVLDIMLDMGTGRIPVDSKDSTLLDSNKFSFNIIMSKANLLFKKPFISPLNRQPFYISNTFFQFRISIFTELERRYIIGIGNGEDEWIERTVLISIPPLIRSVLISYSTISFYVSSSGGNINRSEYNIISLDRNGESAHIQYSNFNVIYGILENILKVPMYRESLTCLSASQVESSYSSKLNTSISNTKESYVDLVTIGREVYSSKLNDKIPAGIIFKSGISQANGSVISTIENDYYFSQISSIGTSSVYEAIGKSTDSNVESIYDEFASIFIDNSLSVESIYEDLAKVVPGEQYYVSSYIEDFVKSKDMYSKINGCSFEIIGNFNSTFSNGYFSNMITLRIFK